MKTLYLLLCSCLLVAALKAQIPTNGLVAWWPFNGNANDESGNGNNGTVNGARHTTDRFGNFNSAYCFNGVDNYILISNFFNNISSEPLPLSISAWVKTSSSKIGQSIISQDIGCDPSFGHFDIVIYGDGDLTTEIWGHSPRRLHVASSEINNDIWHHILLNFDGSQTSLLIDGVQKDVLDITNFNISNFDDIVIGNYIVNYCDNGFAFDGKIDDMRIYNCVLNQNEIKAIFHEGDWAVKPSFSNILSDKIVCKNDNTAFEVIPLGIPPIHYQWQKDGADIQGANDSVFIIPHIKSEDEGKYRCIGTNAFGIDTSNTAKLWVEFSIPTNILGSTEVIGYQVVTYSVAKKEGHTYDFMAEGGNIIDGTENSITVHWGVTSEGFVKLIETSEVGCVADTNTLKVNIGPVGVEDQEIQGFSVYPNPFTSLTTFSYTLTEPSPVILQVYNAYGQLIDTPVNEQQSAGNHQVQWNAERFSAGIYFYRLTTSGTQLTAYGKLVVIE